MKIKTVKVFCDRCNQQLEAKMGFEVVGNIGVVTDNDSFAGLIGNSFPQPDQNGLIPIDGIKATHWCVPCFLKACSISVTGSAFFATNT